MISFFKDCREGGKKKLENQNQSLASFKISKVLIDWQIPQWTRMDSQSGPSFFFVDVIAASIANFDAAFESEKVRIACSRWVHQVWWFR